MNFLLKSQRVLCSSSEAIAPRTLEVRDEKIAAIHPYSFASALPCFDAGEKLVMPGLVDSHAHINEPGRADWEGFETATRAAAAGGITTVVDMPLNSIPPTTTLAALQAKSSAASGKCTIDYALWGGVIPGNTIELLPMAKSGVPGFKAFLIDSGVPEFPPVGETELRSAMRVLGGMGVPLLAHAELCAHLTPEIPSTKYHDYLNSRPPEWEIEAIRLLIRLCRETGCAVHIVHLSAAEALRDLAAAWAEGLPVTAETCPHYLALSAEGISDGETQFKCAPPIRQKENQERLWDGLKEGVLNLIVSDHSPCTPALKKRELGDFTQAWGGISGLEVSLRVVWTEMRRRKLPLSLLAKWMCEEPARLAGLFDCKGSLKVGKDADLVVWDPEKIAGIQAQKLHHRHPITPFDGREVAGEVLQTYVRGHLVYDRGAFPSVQGKELRRRR